MQRSADCDTVLRTPARSARWPGRNAALRKARQKTQSSTSNSGICVRCQVEHAPAELGVLLQLSVLLRIRAPLQRCERRGNQLRLLGIETVD